MTEDELGYGIIVPFQRDGKSDFASDGGVRLIRSHVRQRIAIRGGSRYTQGEFPWRTDFGSLLDLLRHKNSLVVVQEMAKVYVRRSLRGMANVRLKAVESFKKDNQVWIRVIYFIILGLSPSDTNFGPFEEELKIS